MSMTHMLNKVERTLAPKETNEKVDTLRQLEIEILDLLKDNEKSMTDEIQQPDAFNERIYAAMVRIDKFH